MMMDDDDDDDDDDASCVYSSEMTTTTSNSSMTGMSQTMPWSADDDDLATGNKRSILKWETDEALGLNATISAVLYVNTNFPTLKTEYPGE
jgi:hypothetical protein